MQLESLEVTTPHQDQSRVFYFFAMQDIVRILR